MKKKRTVCAIVLITSGVLVLVFAGVLNIIVDAIVAKELNEKLALKNGTIGYEKWLKPPVPVMFKLYVFDVTNPDEVLKGLEQPAVVEKGPYVYRMSLHKTNIVRHDDNDTIAYVQPQSYAYDRDASVGSENDNFTSINIPYMTMASSLQHWPGFIQRLVNVFMHSKGETPFKTLSIDQIFWGYEDPVLKEGYEFLKKLGITLPYLQPKFGFFYDKNNTGDGNYSVFSGMNGNLNNYNNIDLWNKERKLDLWSTPEANAIYGTDGSMFPPYATSDSKLTIFDAYLHRTLKLKYEGESSYEGLDTLHFVVPFSAFENATDNPDNAGYCTPNINNCIPSGCYNLTRASYGAPFYVSMPHFCGGDPYYRRLVMGLSPDPKKHQPYNDIFGLVGVSVKAARRYQINLRIQSYEYFEPFQKLPMSYLPIMWIDGEASIDDKDVAEFRDQIQSIMKAVPISKYVMISVGIFLIVLVCCLVGYWYCKGKSKKEEQEALLSDEHPVGHDYNSKASDSVQDIPVKVQNV